jgi:hypothetical protein
MQRLTNPLPLFIDSRGALLDAGYVYVGVPNGDPELEDDQIDLFLDADLTEPIPQPLRTLGGLIVSDANAVPIFFAEENYSIRVKDANEQLVYYLPSAADAAAGTPAYQPVDEDLTLIAQQGTSPYGRSLLSLPNQAALQAAVGGPSSLPLTGGTVSGNIVRSGKGVHPYFNDPAMTGGRLFMVGPSDPDPSSLPGDFVLRTTT